MIFTEFTGSSEVRAGYWSMTYTAGVEYRFCFTAPFQLFKICLRSHCSILAFQILPPANPENFLRTHDGSAVRRLKSSKFASEPLARKVASGSIGAVEQRYSTTAQL